MEYLMAYKVFHICQIRVPIKWFAFSKVSMNTIIFSSIRIKTHIENYTGCLKRNLYYFPPSLFICLYETNRFFDLKKGLQYMFKTEPQ